jgi:hypothetical protein
VENGGPKKDVPDVKAKERSLLSAIRSFVIVLALSIHAIFEGMAIGKRAKSSGPNVTKLFTSVIYKRL